MRRSASICTVLLISLLVVSTTSAAEKSLEKLKAEADKSHGGKQGELYAEIAERLVDVANRQFDQGQSVQGHATVQEILASAIKAHDLGISARDRRKEIEIHLRETQHNLESMKHTLAAVDRPSVDQVENKLEELRQELLESMFSPGKKKKEGP